MLLEDRQKRLQELTDRIASEKDPEKSIQLVKEMNTILDEIQLQLRKPRPS